MAAVRPRISENPLESPENRTESNANHAESNDSRLNTPKTRVTSMISDYEKVATPLRTFITARFPNAFVNVFQKNGRWRAWTDFRPYTPAFGELLDLIAAIGQCEGWEVDHFEWFTDMGERSGELTFRGPVVEGA